MRIEPLPGTVTREQAIDKATEIVERMGNAEDLNKRGYKIDGWKPPTATERADAIIRIAAFLVGPDRLPTLVAPAPVSRGTQHPGHAEGECPGPPECL